jgi:hypothetical protein
MRRWDIQDIADDAELMTSELAANAVQHTTGSHYTVAIRVSAGLLIVEVFDDEPRMPALGEPDLTSDCGRGLAALAALAKDWGASGSPPCKCVWFTLQLSATSPQRPNTASEAFNWRGGDRL